MLFSQTSTIIKSIITIRIAIMCPQNQKNIDRHTRELEKNAHLNRQSTL
jgi:hypothetical protein